MISANQNRRNSSIFLFVCSYEIFEIRSVVILLATAQAEFTNRGDIRLKLPFTDKDFGGSLAAIEPRASSWYLEHRIISQGVMDSEQTSYAQSFRSGTSTKLYQHKSEQSGSKSLPAKTDGRRLLN